MKNTNKHIISQLDDIQFKIWLFEKYLKTQPKDATAFTIKERYIQKLNTLRYYEDFEEKDEIKNIWC